jgi:hypothetical protein
MKLFFHAGIRNPYIPHVEERMTISHRGGTMRGHRGQKSEDAALRSRELKSTLRIAISFWRTDRSLTLLLVLLVALLFVATPLEQHTRIGVALNGVVFTLLAITGTAAVTRRIAIVLAVTLLGLARLALDGFVHGPMAEGMLLGDLLLRASFVLLIAVLVTSQIFRPGNFSHHRVQGAVVIYLLAALAWAYAYEIVYLLEPNSLHISLMGKAIPDLALFRFFSFETLTTLGYGDVYPVGSVARSLAAGEAVFGQLFPAVMIARFVGLEIAARTARQGR